MFVKSFIIRWARCKLRCLKSKVLISYKHGVPFRWYAENLQTEFQNVQSAFWKSLRNEISLAKYHTLCYAVYVNIDIDVCISKITSVNNCRKFFCFCSNTVRIWHVWSYERHSIAYWIIWYKCFWHRNASISLFILSRYYQYWIHYKAL